MMIHHYYYSLYL